MMPLDPDYHEEAEVHSLSDFLRLYKYTSIYSAVVLTLILIAFVLELTRG